MKIKSTTGHVIYRPLVYDFNMLEIGGSWLQKYDVTKKEYIPNRALTPYVLRPYLGVEDLDAGVKMVGTYALVNVSWTVDAQHDGIKFVLGTDYSVNDSTHELIIRQNCDSYYAGKIRFEGEYVDSRRGDTQHFSWSHDMSTVAAATSAKMILRINGNRQSCKINVYALGDISVLTLPAQLYAGNDEVVATYHWQVFDNNIWRDINTGNTPDLWYVQGSDDKNLIINRAYIQRVLLRCLSGGQSATCLVRRWYGQYDADIRFVTGKYITDDTLKCVGEANVTNRQGDIAEPCKFFDIEILFDDGTGHWTSVSTSETAEVNRSELNADTTLEHKFGLLCREKTALLPITMGGKPVTMGGKFACGQFPNTERNIEE